MDKQTQGASRQKDQKVFQCNPLSVEPNEVVLDVRKLRWHVNLECFLPHDGVVDGPRPGPTKDAFAYRRVCRVPARALAACRASRSVKSKPSNKAASGALSADETAHERGRANQ